MTEDRQSHEDAGGPAGRPRSRRTTVAGLIVALVLVVVGGVAVVRSSDLVPLPAPPVLDPAPDLVDAAGLGAVRLGQRFADFRRVACGDRPCEPEDLSSRSTDSARGCVQIDALEPEGHGWAWLRDGRVVAVGVSPNVHAGRGAASFRTWSGLGSGAPLDPVPDDLARWERDAEAPIPVFRRVHDGTTTTLADVDGDGALDYAVVATPDGEECTPDEPAAEAAGGALSGGPVIEGDALDGIVLGAPAEAVTALPGWAEVPFSHSSQPCRTFWNGSAIVSVTDRVVGLSASSIVGGPGEGMSRADGMAYLDDVTTSRPEAPGYDTVTGTDSQGRAVTLGIRRPPVMVDGLDTPVTAEAATGPGTVTSVTLGRACGDGEEGA